MHGCPQKPHFLACQDKTACWERVRAELSMKNRGLSEILCLSRAWAPEPGLLLQTWTHPQMKSYTPFPERAEQDFSHMLQQRGPSFRSNSLRLEVWVHLSQMEFKYVTFLLRVAEKCRRASCIFVGRPGRTGGQASPLLLWWWGGSEGNKTFLVPRRMLTACSTVLQSCRRPMAWFLLLEISALKRFGSCIL